MGQIIKILFIKKYLFYNNFFIWRSREIWVFPPSYSSVLYLQFYLDFTYTGSTVDSFDKVVREKELN